MSGQGTAALHFEPPGPGSWTLDPVHFPRPVTRYWAEMHPEPFRRGTREFMAYCGTVIESLETQYVNGFAYNAMRPAPEDEIPQRFARAEQVWERKVWREQLREWDDTAKPAAVSRCGRALGRRAGRVSDPLSRAPLADDLPAHALQRVGDATSR